jgi:uncharacterized protein with PQ loop repeat
MEIGNLIGWAGLAVGLTVPIWQLRKILRKEKGVSKLSYITLCFAIACYLWHAIFIRDTVFITAQAVNLTTNCAVLFLLIKNGVH